MTTRQKEIFERQRFSELKQRLLLQEQQLKEERHQIWLREKKSTQEYTVWERLEMLSTDILGYVSQIASKGYTRQQPNEVIKHLHNLSVFEIDCIANWYSTEANDYPKTKQYFELLDYIRLLTLEYIERYLLVKAS